MILQQCNVLLYNSIGDKMKYTRPIVLCVISAVCIGLIVYFAMFFGSAKNENATVTTQAKLKYTITFDSDTIEYEKNSDLMQGVTAKGENGEDLTNDVTISSKPTKNIRKKELTYSINKSGYEITPFTRTLLLPNDYNGPKIELGDEDIEVPIDQIASLTMAINQTGIIKTDDGFGNACGITAKISDDVTEPGDYIAKITVQNAFGDTASKKVTITVTEAKSSIIKLTASTITIKKGAKFDATEYIKSAQHEKLGDVTGAIVINSDVDTSKPGRYTVTYSFGNIEELKNEHATLYVTIE